MPREAGTLGIRGHCSSRHGRHYALELVEPTGRIKKARRLFKSGPCRRAESLVSESGEASTLDSILRTCPWNSPWP